MKNNWQIILKKWIKKKEKDWVILAGVRRVSPATKNETTRIGSIAKSIDGGSERKRDFKDDLGETVFLYVLTHVCAVDYALDSKCSEGSTRSYLQ
jgi:hypothetical protein